MDEDIDEAVATTPGDAATLQFRREVKWIVDHLAGVGVAKATVAERAGVTRPYLSQIVNIDTNEDTSPRGSVRARLARALRDLTSENMQRLRMKFGQPTLADLNARLALLEDNAASTFASPGAPLPGNAENYVERTIDSDALKAMTPKRGDPVYLLLKGPPATGKSSLALRAEALLADQYGTVCFFDVAASRVRNRDSDLRMDLAEQLVRTGPPPGAKTLDGDPAIALRNAFGTAVEAGSVLLIIDGVNDPHSRDLFEPLMRSWSERRGTDSRLRALSVMMVTSLGPSSMGVMKSSEMEYALPNHQSRSLPWFTRVQVEELATELGPNLAQAGANQRINDAVNLAYEWFSGQPLLTHLLLADMLTAGRAEAEATAELSRRGSAYYEHLATLSRLADDPGRPTLLDDAIALVGGDLPETNVDPFLSALGIASMSLDAKPNQVSCKYYAQHLGRLLSGRRSRR